MLLLLLARRPAPKNTFIQSADLQVNKPLPTPPSSSRSILNLNHGPQILASNPSEERFLPLQHPLRHHHLTKLSRTTPTRNRNRNTRSRPPRIFQRQRIFQTPLHHTTPLRLRTTYTQRLRCPGTINTQRSTGISTRCIF